MFLVELRRILLFSMANVASKNFWSYNQVHKTKFSQVKFAMAIEEIENKELRAPS